MPHRLKTRHQVTPHRPVTRGTSRERGYDTAWQKVRDLYIAEHPLCEDCLEENIVNPEHIEVDHVIPIDVRPDLRLDMTNLRSRCRRHHKRKTDRDKATYGSRR